MKQEYLFHFKTSSDIKRIDYDKLLIIKTRPSLSLNQIIHPAYHCFMSQNMHLDYHGEVPHGINYEISLVLVCFPLSVKPHFFAFENLRHLYFSPLTVISRAPSWLSWFDAVPIRTLFSFSRFSFSIFSLASCRAISA